MNKKILGIAVVLLAAAMLTVPVMAKPATKIEATLIVNVAIISDPDFTHDVDHNIHHNIGIATGTATLTTISGDSFNFDYYGTWSGTSKWTDLPNPDPEGTNIIVGKVILTCTNEDITGTFEGVSHTKSIGLPPVPPFGSYVETHTVLQGTGDFKGQTLRVSYAGPPPAPGLEGYLTIPK